MIMVQNRNWLWFRSACWLAIICALASLSSRLSSRLQADDDEVVSDTPARKTDPTSDPSTSNIQSIIEPEIATSDREHWSFLPLQRPDVPNTLHVKYLTTEPVQAGRPVAALPRNAIDAFILQRLEADGLELMSAASPRELLRRISFDLTGLPPTQEVIARVESREHDDDAIDREVDRWLASPACGEHLAQAWLDLARYAETDGFEHDKVRPKAWQYRDWVINAINSDMPYDQFMRLQIAGDLTNDPQGVLATTFCLAGPDMPDINDQDERRHNLLNEMTGTVGSVFLGLQLGCAACHDHKYDPVSQADFYRLRAVLESGVPELVRDKPWNTFSEQPKLPASHFYNRGDHRQPTIELARGVPRIVASAETNRLVSTAAQPRLVLADWLASQENPLAARTMANRVWQSHFGRGLAGTPSDLGLIGIEPTHGKLLDWLACELRDGWSIQRLRRSLLSSAVYRAPSHALPADELASNQQDSFSRVLAIDPDNRLYGRFNRRRLGAEALRDAMLACAGLLDRQIGGPSVMPALPSELVESLLPGQWKASDRPVDQARRSIYIFARRNLRYPIFESFDRPDAGASCPERSRSVTATQSLLMFNSEFSWQIAESLARQAAECDTDSEQLRCLWLSTLGRSPHHAELAWSIKYLSASKDRSKALVGAALALLNSNEFITID